MISYVEPPVVATGQILGRSYLGILRDNDEYFMGLADGLRCVNRGEYKTWIGTETSIDIWDGYHLKATDTETLNYYFVLSGSDGDPTAVTLYYYDLETPPGAHVVAHEHANGTYSGTFDLSGYDDGVHRVLCRMTRPDYTASTIAYVKFRPPYSIYTGAQAYTAPVTITDGDVGEAADFNTWRTNDLYFNACKPRQPAFSGMTRAHVGDATTTVIWDGWIKYHEHHTLLHYSLNMESTLAGSHMVLIFDADGAREVCYTKNAAGAEEGTYDVGAYVNGTFYRVTVELHRTDTTYNPTGTVYWLRMGPAVGDEMAGFTLMDDFTVGQSVYGSTAAQLTRLDYLSDNDAVIRPALTWDASHGRLDFAVESPYYERLGGTDYGNMRLLHQSDLLYYVGAGDVKWGDTGSCKLEPTTTTDPYLILDLTTLADFPYGLTYFIYGQGCDFAMEV